MKIELLNTGIYSVNTWIIYLSENTVFVVDPANCTESGDENCVSEYLKKRNLTLLGIFLTHGHFDHIPGCKILKSDFKDVQIACHKKDLKLCGSNAFEVQGKILSDSGMNYIVSSLKNLPEPDCVFENNKTLDEVFKTSDEKIKFALKDWKIIHTPGHTEGSCVLYNQKENILISGDTIFYHSWGRTDFPGGSEAEMNKSLNYIYSNLPKQTKVFPGHGEFGFPLSENM